MMLYYGTTGLSQVGIIRRFGKDDPRLEKTRAQRINSGELLNLFP